MSTDATDLARRTADRLAIHELYGRYCFGLDTLNDEEVLDCFTPDGVFSLGDRGDFAGHDAIQAILDASRDTRSRHYITNIVVDELNDEEGRVRAYFQLIHPTDGRTVSCGHYDDDVVKCDDGAWRWTIKRIDFLWRSDDYAKRSEGQQADDLVGADEA